MGSMYEPKLCSTCKIGHLIPTGNGLDEFRCNNPECNQRVVDKQLFENMKSGDDVDMEHTREEIGD